MHRMFYIIMTMLEISSSFRKDPLPLPCLPTRHRLANTEAALVAAMAAKADSTLPARMALAP
jgi:hypothetical protein